jgi:hypothetical protein
MRGFYPSHAMPRSQAVNCEVAVLSERTLAPAAGIDKCPMTAQGCGRHPTAGVTLEARGSHVSGAMTAAAITCDCRACQSHGPSRSGAAISVKRRNCEYAAPNRPSNWPMTSSEAGASRRPCECMHPTAMGDSVSQRPFPLFLAFANSAEELTSLAPVVGGEEESRHARLLPSTSVNPRTHACAFCLASLHQG